MPPKKAQTSAKASSSKKAKATAAASPSTKSPRKGSVSAKKALDTSELEAVTTKKSSSAKKTSAKSPSPGKTSVASSMPASKKSASAKTGSKRPAAEDAVPNPSPKRGRGRPRKEATPVDEDEVIESIEETVRCPGRPRSATPRARSSGPSATTRSLSPAKRLQPAPADPKPRQRSVSQGRRAAPSAEREVVTPSRKQANKGLSSTGLSGRMASSSLRTGSLKATQQLLRDLNAQDESDTPMVGEDNIYFDEPVTRRPSTSRARSQSRQPSRTTPAPSAHGTTSSSPKKPDTATKVKKEGHGSVTSFTNPENIPDDDHSSEYKDKQGRGPFPNPFHEKMPLKEVWYRNQPPMFPFGETPYFEQKMSDQINADLSRSHQETLDAQKKQKGSGSVLGEIGSASSVLGMVTGTGSPKKSPTKSPKKRSTDEKRFSPWDLPEIDATMVTSFAQSSGITA